jgi:hypothetical protein
MKAYTMNKNNWDSEKDQIIEKFNELKKSGKSFSLGDILSDDQKTRLQMENVVKSKPQISNDESHGSELISDYVLEVSKFVDEIEIINSYSFTFEYNNKSYFIGYDFNSECVIFNEGKIMFQKKCREIGLYEIEDIFK